jgi:hypothetical protein
MNKYFVLLNMESVYHIVAIRVNETSWAHVWRLRSRYLGMGYAITRIEISFPENFRSIWVVVIVLEFLSVACPSLGLCIFYVTSFLLMSPCQCYCYLFLLVWRIGFE